MSQWPLSEKGLLYDREWLILAENGVALSQKQEPRMCTISPLIDLEGGTLTLSVQGVRWGMKEGVVRGEGRCVEGALIYELIPN